MMNGTDTQTLVVGQGICGTLLSFELYKAGKPFLVIDNDLPNTAGKVASGLINPVTGMRMAKAWMIDELLPAAIATYRELETLLDIAILQPYPLLTCFSASTDALLFAKRAEQYPEYLRLMDSAAALERYFRVPHGAGIVSCYLVNITGMLSAWRKWLEARNLLITDTLRWGDVAITEQGFGYGPLTARYMVCAEGAWVRFNPYFRHSPFAMNKGQALIAEIPGLPADAIYLSDLKIAPWENGQFWIGSSFERTWDDESPTNGFRKQTEQLLAEWLKIPYTITDHLAAVRPATMNRLPITEWHTLHPRLGIFNGMGAKGCSQAPYFARTMAAQVSG